MVTRPRMKSTGQGMPLQTLHKFSFDHHPAAYKLIGPRDFNGYEMAATYWVSIWNLAPILLVFGLTFGPDVYNLLWTVARVFQDNWLYAVTTTISSITDFGTDRTSCSLLL